MESRRSRIIGVIAVLCVGVAIVFALNTQSTEPPAAAVPPRPEIADLVERRLREKDVVGARAELEAVRGRTHRAWAAYLEGLIHISEGDRAAARTVLEEALESLPNDLHVMDALRATLTGSPADQRLEGQLIERFLKLNPRDERAVLAAALHALRGPEEQRDPERAWALMHQIREQRQQGEQPAVNVAQHEISLLWVQAEADSQTGRHATALAEAKQLSKLAPKQPDVWAFCGDVARRAGKLGAAMQAYEVAVELAPDVQRYQEYLVQLALAMPSPKEEFQRVLIARTDILTQTWPESRSARVLRARALVRSTDVEPEGYDKARLIYEALRAENPEDLEVLRNLGALLYDWKQGGQPGDYLEDAYRIFTEYLRLGGTLDEQLQDVWERLKQRRADRAVEEGGDNAGSGE